VLLVTAAFFSGASHTAIAFRLAQAAPPMMRSSTTAAVIQVRLIFVSPFVVRQPSSGSQDGVDLRHRPAHAFFHAHGDHLFERFQ
jgi:hypothetical protein